jgi:hypothetical protein
MSIIPFEWTQSLYFQTLFHHQYQHDGCKLYEQHIKSSQHSADVLYGYDKLYAPNMLASNQFNI